MDTFGEVPFVKPVEWFREQDPKQVLMWVNTIVEGRQEVPEYFNWLGLAQLSANQARSRDDAVSSIPDLDWAKVAIVVYDYLINKADPARRDSLEHSVMMLRAYLIVKLGVVPHDPVLDIEHIVQWFFQNLRLSLAEAARRSASWKELKREEILELRQIKNRLAVIRSLAEHNLLSHHPELQPWLALREKLP
jgi:hypothetical protein